ncbi:MAG TPA: aromatic amino acid lyase, partial [candidate division Zixibacteria bacterium]|nr:aromatic amino acid lyase [candidate division Zixibacteria bacterium]
MTASSAQPPVIIGDSRLTLADVAEVAREYRHVTLGEQARTRVRLSRAIVDALMRRNVKIYGITTGFASLRDRRIDAAD